MAITLVGANVEVAGYKAGPYTSDTGQSATTIGNTTAGWTVNGFTNRVVWIITGTGAGATGIIASNTAAVITVDRFAKVNVTGAPVSVVTPDNTSVFAIAWNFADAVAALPANLAWDNATTTRTLRCNSSVVVKVAGAFGDVYKSLALTTPDTKIDTEAGSLFQMGRINASLQGQEGGLLTVEKVSTAFVTPTQLGLTKLFGTVVMVNKGPSAGGFEWRWGGVSASAHDGIHCIDTKFYQVQALFTTNDVLGRVEIGKNRLSVFPAMPSKIDAVSYPEGMLSLGPAKGGDFFDFRSSGTITDPTYSKPLIFNTSTLPNYVAYLWRPNLGLYPDLTACIDWYTGSTTRNGIAYFGTTLSLSTKTSAGAILGTVAVGVINTSNGVGQIVTGKGALGVNYAPVKSKFITTDVNGVYTGPFGSGEGIFIATHKLVNGGSVYLSTVTDYTGYSLVLSKYGYIQQVLSRAYAYNTANLETAYLNADPFVQGAYATVIAYTGIAMTIATKTLVLSGARTFQEFYDFIKARVEYEAKINDVHVVDPFTTTDGINYTLASDWTLTPSNYLTWGGRVSGGKLIYAAVGTYSPKIGVIALEFTAATGTYDLRTADINGTVTLTNTGGGSITVQLPVGVVVVNTGPNITVDQSASVNITIGGFLTTSRLQIYDVNAAMELYNGVPGATSKTIAVSYTVNKPIRFRVADPGSAGANAMKFIETTQTLTAIGLSYTATQIADTTYNSNAIDGSTVTGITITPSPARVAINIAGGSVTWPQIYAYQVYWLSTATGIADESAFIEASDTANYILTNFDIKNTNANPLTLTGGWGRDSVTLTVAGCMDVAGSTGNMYAQPDHIVAFAAGSALTAGQDAALTAIKSVTSQFNFTVANQVDANALTGGGGGGSSGLSLPEFIALK